MSRIKFGVCGLGRIGSRHAEFFAREKDKYELVAVCDMDAQRAAESAKKHNCAGYSDYAEFLRNPQMELTIISTRSLDHVSNTSDALHAGKTVLLDKPIAVTSADFRRLRELEKDYRGKLFFLHNVRFNPVFQTILRIVDSGILGETKLVKIRRHHGFSRRCDWQTLLSCGGGQLSCWGPHVIDQGLQLINAPVKQVWGHLQRVNSCGDADDQVKIMLVGGNGVVADLEISYAAALREDYCTVYGNRGTLVCANDFNKDAAVKVKYLDPSFEFADRQANQGDPVTMVGQGFSSGESFPWIEEEIKVEPAGSPPDMWETGLLLALHKALREGVPFPVTTEHAFEVVRITEEVKKQNPQFNWL